MKTLKTFTFVIALSALISGCGSIYNSDLSGGDDMYSVKETAVPLGESINDDLSYSSYKYEKEQRNSSNLNQSTVYSNNYNNFYSPSYNFNYGYGFRHPMSSFGYNNYGYNSYYGYPSHLSYGYNSYYGWGMYPSYGMGYGYNPYGYGYNPYGYGNGYGHNPYGYGGYGYDPYGYGYNPYNNNNYYGNSGSSYGNTGSWGNNSSTNTAPGIHYSGPRSNNSGGGVVTRKNVPNTVGLAPAPTSFTPTEKVSTVRPNAKLTDNISTKQSTINRPATGVINKNEGIESNRSRPAVKSVYNNRINNTIQTPATPNPVIHPVRPSTITHPTRPISAPSTVPTRSVPTKTAPAQNRNNTIQTTPSRIYSAPSDNNNNYSAPTRSTTKETYNVSPTRSSGSSNSRGSGSSNTNSNSGGNMRGR